MKLSKRNSPRGKKKLDSPAATRPEIARLEGEGGPPPEVARRQLSKNASLSKRANVSKNARSFKREEQFKKAEQVKNEEPTKNDYQGPQITQILRRLLLGWRRPAGH